MYSSQNHFRALYGTFQGNIYFVLVFFVLFYLSSSMAFSQSLLETDEEVEFFSKVLSHTIEEITLSEEVEVDFPWPPPEGEKWIPLGFLESAIIVADAMGMGISPFSEARGKVSDAMVIYLGEKRVSEGRDESPLNVCMARQRQYKRDFINRVRKFQFVAELPDGKLIDYQSTDSKLDRDDPEAFIVIQIAILTSPGRRYLFTGNLREQARSLFVAQANNCPSSTPAQSSQTD